MGVRFQAPRDQDSQIIIHVRMLDTETRCSRKRSASSA